MDNASEKLIEQSQKGNNQAFGELVMLYGDYVFALVFRLVTIEAVAEDITQDVFIKAWRNIQRYNSSKAKFSTWLYTIASRLALDYLRSKKMNEPIDDSLEVYTNEEGEMDNVELGQLIRKACNGLTETQKLVFVLRDLEELEVKEVHSVTGFSKKKIKDNLYVARKKIREKLGFYLKI